MFVVKLRGVWGGRFWVGGGCPVGLPVAEHCEQDVAAASGQADEGGVVLLALGSFAVVVGLAGRVGAQGCEGGQEQGAFEVLVARAGGELAADAGAGASGDGGEAGVGGQMSGGREL